jgi:hypothetical protein
MFGTIQEERGRSSTNRLNDFFSHPHYFEAYSKQFEDPITSPNASRSPLIDQISMEKRYK